MAGKYQSKVQRARISSGHALRKMSQDELEVVLVEHDKWLMFQARLSVSITGSKEFRDVSDRAPLLDVAELVTRVKEENEWFGRIDREAEGSCADLSYTDLSELNLSNRDLSEASLRGAKLHYTNLEHAILRNTNLAEADLRHARLFTAHLSEA